MILGFSVRTNGSESFKKLISMSVSVYHSSHTINCLYISVIYFHITSFLLSTPGNGNRPQFAEGNVS